MNRKTRTRITRSEWIAEGRYTWLTVWTEATGERPFSTFGMSTDDYEAGARYRYERFAVGSEIAIGDLHTLPIGTTLLAKVPEGGNIHLGTLNDGLVDLCGPLGFARYIRLGDVLPVPGTYREAAWAAVRLIATDGIGRAKAYLEQTGLFDRVYQFSVGGPAISDECVVELNHA